MDPIIIELRTNQTRHSVKLPTEEMWGGRGLE